MVSSGVCVWGGAEGPCPYWTSPPWPRELAPGEAAFWEEGRAGPPPAGSSQAGQPGEVMVTSTEHCPLPPPPLPLATALWASCQPPLPGVLADKSFRWEPLPAVTLKGLGGISGPGGEIFWGQGPFQNP